MKFVKFTDLTNNTIYVCPTWVQMVRPPLLNEFAKNASSVLVLSGLNIAVKEPPSYVIRQFQDPV